jgi:hypothetical protein
MPTTNTMFRLAALYITLLNSSLGFSQQIIFQKSYDLGFRTYGKSIIPTPSDGGYMVAGSVYRDTSTSWDDVLLKTDANGDTLWTKIVAKPGEQLLNCIRNMPNGGYITCGATFYQTAGADDALLIRYDQNGNELWRKQFGDAEYDYIRSLEVLSDGTLMMTGGSNKKIWLRKTDQEGNLIWQKIYGNNIWNDVRDVEPLKDGGFAIAATLQTTDFDLDMYIIRTDSLGNTKWAKQFGYPQYDEALAVRETPIGNLLVAGYREQPINKQGVILELDAAGNRLVDLPIGYHFEDYYIDIQVLNDQYVYVGGIQTPDPDTNFYFNSNGLFTGINEDCDTLWNLAVDNHDFQFYNNSCLSSDGGIVATGNRKIWWTPQLWSDTIGLCLVKINGFPVASHEPKTEIEPMRVYPNPSSGPMLCSFNFGAIQGDYLLIRDVSGRLIQTLEIQAGIHNVPIDLSDQPAGFYICTYLRAGAQALNAKIIITHPR